MIIKINWLICIRTDPNTKEEEEEEVGIKRPSFLPLLLIHGLIKEEKRNG